MREGRKSSTIFREVRIDEFKCPVVSTLISTQVRTGAHSHKLANRPGGKVRNGQRFWPGTVLSQDASLQPFPETETDILPMKGFDIAPGLDLTPSKPDIC